MAKIFCLDEASIGDGVSIEDQGRIEVIPEEIDIKKKLIDSMNQSKIKKS